MEEIENYILRNREERQKHLRLDEPCDERGGMSSYCKALLAYYLDTSIPSGRKVHVCHACHNSKCSNVRHLYWGTPSENVADAIANGKPASPYHHAVQKYGVDEANRLQKRNGNQNGKGNAGNTLSESHRRNISKGLLGKPGNAGGAGRPPEIASQELVNLVRGTGFKEVAERLNIDIDAVRHRYYRAKNTLNK